jgi:hypothetical protein
MVNNKMRAELDKQSAEVNNLVSKLLKYEKALYHPKTRTKLFILKGLCCKADCKANKKEEHLKVLLPASSFQDFRRYIPLDRVGKAVVCFSHFFYKHQKDYIINGQFPESVRLKRAGENLYNLEKVVIPNPKPFAKKIDKKTGREISGFKASPGAYIKNDWVCN